MAARRFDNFEYRTVADKSAGERIRKYDPDTGAAKLVNPATEGDDHEPWPVAGYDWANVDAEGFKPPARVKLPAKLVQKGQMEGWIELENPRLVYRPGGPAEDPQRVVHTFVHADGIIFHFMSGDYAYDVVENPDKYAAPDSNEPGEAGSQEAAVYWSYHLKAAA